MKPNPGKPNVLFVSVDQWPGDLLGVADHPVIDTPTLDQLARNGVRFTRAYSECPICIPARRSMMTGTSPRTHGDRLFRTTLRMPALPTLAQTFRDAGYQANAVGKLHVYPARDRIGFDDVLLAEEGRPQLGAVDDYDLFLADRGFAGQQFLHGMSNNEYAWRPWHLPEECHVTNWISAAMARTIKRRDPTRPAFWTVSYTAPHPPLAPLQAYLEVYRDRAMDEAAQAQWSCLPETLPYPLKLVQDFWAQLRPEQLAGARRAFYALCTHVDHQLRVILGTLREEGLLDNTIVLVTADHGDMLGDNGLYAKRYLYEGSANVPMILMGVNGCERVGHHRTDDRLVGLQDVMPTLLDLCGLDVPSSCEGLSMVGPDRRGTLYCEALAGEKATRMIHDGRHKLIWYPCGNRFHLFDLAEDPRELRDMSQEPDYAAVRQRLETALTAELYGDDLAWVEDGRLVGCAEPEFRPAPNRAMSGQRGLHYPTPPIDPNPERVAGMP